MIPIAAKFTAWSPEPQKRFTDVAEIASGHPAASTAFRATFAPCSPTCPTHPITTSSTSSGATPVRRVRARSV
jgi:hypothetical protein